jgi:cytochrome c553
MKTLLLLALAGAAFATGAQAADIAAGKAATEKYNCASCHGKDFTTPIDPSYPKLAGQHKDYLAHVLVEYQRGGNGPNGRGNAIMGGQAKALSKVDIENIAAYLSSLPGPLTMQK